MLKIIKLIFIFCLFSNLLSAEEGVNVLKIKAAEAKMDLDSLKDFEKSTEISDFEMILVNNFFAEYYYKIDKNEKLMKEYVDKTIGIINKSVLTNGKINEKAEMYAILADNYGKKIDGFFTAMEYGKKSQEAIEKAYKIDAENERAKYVRAKIYMSAPPIAGGDPQKSQKYFEELVKANGDNSFYYTYLAIVRGSNGNKNTSKEAFKKAFEIAKQNKFAESEMKK